MKTGIPNWWLILVKEKNQINAFVERIFSIMKNVWTDPKNKMNPNLVQAEVLHKVNYNMSCEEFFKFISQPEQKELLKKVMSNEKYIWKKNSK